MAKSKYQAEFEDFKKKLPEVLLRHADANGLDLCNSGLNAFFSEMGVDWEPPRQPHYMSISARGIMLPARGAYDEVTTEGQNEVDEFHKELVELAKKYKFWGDGSHIDIDEYYQ